MKRFVKRPSCVYASIDVNSSHPLKKYRYDFLEIEDYEEDDYEDFVEVMLPDDESAYLVALAKDYGYFGSWYEIHNSSTEELLQVIESLKEDEPDVCKNLLSSPVSFLDDYAFDCTEPGCTRLLGISQSGRELYDYYHRRYER